MAYNFLFCTILGEYPGGVDRSPLQAPFTSFFQNSCKNRSLLHTFSRYAISMGFKANKTIFLELQNPDKPYWETKRKVAGQVARSRGKEGLFFGWVTQILWSMDSLQIPRLSIGYSLSGLNKISAFSILSCPEGHFTDDQPSKKDPGGFFCHDIVSDARLTD